MPCCLINSFPTRVNYWVTKCVPNVKSLDEMLVNHSNVDLHLSTLSLKWKVKSSNHIGLFCSFIPLFQDPGQVTIIFLLIRKFCFCFIEGCWWFFLWNFIKGPYFFFQDLQHSFLEKRNFPLFCAPFFDSEPNSDKLDNSIEPWDFTLLQVK